MLQDAILKQQQLCRITTESDIGRKCQFGEWGECPSIPQITQPQELVPFVPANDIKRLKKQVLDLKSVKTSLQHESRLIAKENQILQVIHI